MQDKKDENESVEYELCHNSNSDSGNDKGLAMELEIQEEKLGFEPNSDLTLVVKQTLFDTIKLPAEIWEKILRHLGVVERVHLSLVSSWFNQLVKKNTGFNSLQLLMTQLNKNYPLKIFFSKDHLEVDNMIFPEGINFQILKEILIKLLYKQAFEWLPLLHMTQANPRQKIWSFFCELNYFDKGIYLAKEPKYAVLNQLMMTHMGNLTLNNLVLKEFISDETLLSYIQENFGWDREFVLNPVKMAKALTSLVNLGISGMGFDDFVYLARNLLVEESKNLPPRAAQLYMTGHMKLIKTKKGEIPVYTIAQLQDTFDERKQNPDELKTVWNLFATCKYLVGLSWIIWLNDRVSTKIPSNFVNIYVALGAYDREVIQIVANTLFKRLEKKAYILLRMGKEHWNIEDRLVRGEEHPDTIFGKFKKLLSIFPALIPHEKMLLTGIRHMGSDLPLDLTVFLKMKQELPTLISFLPAMINWKLTEIQELLEYSRRFDLYNACENGLRFSFNITWSGVQNFIINFDILSLDLLSVLIPYSEMNPIETSLVADCRSKEDLLAKLRALVPEDLGKRKHIQIEGRLNKKGKTDKKHKMDGRRVSHSDNLAYSLMTVPVFAKKKIEFVLIDFSCYLRSRKDLSHKGVWTSINRYLHHKTTSSPDVFMLSSVVDRREPFLFCYIAREIYEHFRYSESATKDYTLHQLDENPELKQAVLENLSSSELKVFTSKLYDKKDQEVKDTHLPALPQFLFFRPVRIELRDSSKQTKCSLEYSLRNP